MSVYDEMKEDAVSGVYWKPTIGKIDKIRFLGDPVRREPSAKVSRVSYDFPITTEDDPKTPRIWSVSAKGALGQISGFMISKGLKSITGAVLQIVIMGEGMERKYTILPVLVPAPTDAAQVLLDFPAGSLEKALPKLFAPDIPAAPRSA